MNVSCMRRFVLGASSSSLRSLRQVRSPVWSVASRAASGHPMATGVYQLPSTVLSDTRNLTREHIMDTADYLPMRKEAQRARMELRKQRRVHVGPVASVTFECFDFLWTQIQEMLVIEGGGEEQLVDELEAYSPLVPRGRDLIFTLMFEIDFKPRRDKLLAELDGVEHHIKLRTESAAGKFEESAVSSSGDAIERSQDGKTSAVHFLKFVLSEEHAKAFPDAESVTLAITHPSYNHSVTLPLDTLTQVKKDID